jgi:hypothetical protein
VVGGPEQVADDRDDQHAGFQRGGVAADLLDQIKTKVLDAGVDGVILSPATMAGYQPGGITAVAEKLKPLLLG